VSKLEGRDFFLLCSCLGHLLSHVLSVFFSSAGLRGLLNCLSMCKYQSSTSCYYDGLQI